MYILVKDSIPLGLQAAAIAHASLACYLDYKDDCRMVDWLANSFKKVICQVNEKEFNAAKEFILDRVLMTESALNGAETALAFVPCEEWPKPFKFYRMLK